MKSRLGLILHLLGFLLNLVFYKILVNSIGTDNYSHYQSVVALSPIIMFGTFSGFTPLFIRASLGSKPNIANHTYYWKTSINMGLLIVFILMYLCNRSITFFFLIIVLSNLNNSLQLQQLFVHKKFLSLRALNMGFPLLRLLFFTLISNSLHYWLLLEVLCTLVTTSCFFKDACYVRPRRALFLKGLHISLNTFWANMSTYIDRLVLSFTDPIILTSYHLGSAPVIQAKNVLKPLIDQTVIGTEIFLKRILNIVPFIVILFSTIFVRYFYRLDWEYVIYFTIPISISIFFVQKRLRVGMKMARSRLFEKNIVYARNMSMLKVVMVSITALIDVMYIGLVLLLFEILFFRVYVKIESRYDFL